VAPAGEQRRHVGGEPGSLAALDAEDADAALLQAHHQVGDRRSGEIEGGQVEHHGLAQEEAGRSRQRGIDILQPFHDRHDRGEHESEVGAASQTDQLAGGLNIYVHGSTQPLLLNGYQSSDMVNEGLMPCGGNWASLRPLFFRKKTGFGARLP
jgi:hypothetical protein